MTTHRFADNAHFSSELATLLSRPKRRSEDFAELPLPSRMLALVIEAGDEARILAQPADQRDPADALRLKHVPVPALKDDEVLVAVMAAGINHNTIWSSRFLPGSPFEYLRRFAALSPRNAGHLQDYMVLGSDAAGVVLRTGAQVMNCRPGDEVCIHPGVVNDHAPECHADDLLSPETRAWGFETNFGAFAEFTVVRASQILPKPKHLSWAEAATMPLVNGTVYRMLVSPNGAQMRLGESVLIWGAAGGLGLIASQYVLQGGGDPVCVVSNDERAEALRRMGVRTILNRNSLGEGLWQDDGQPNERAVARMRSRIRAATGSAGVDLVFEHTGADTFWASVALLRHGGRIVTCGSTSGHDHRYDNRRLWMHVKSIIGSHGANYLEAWRANQLVCSGRIMPVLTKSGSLTHASALIGLVHQNRHLGKVAILCHARDDRDGIRDPARREGLRVDDFRSRILAAA